MYQSMSMPCLLCLTRKIKKKGTFICSTFPFLPAPTIQVWSSWQHWHTLYKANMLCCFGLSHTHALSSHSNECNVKWQFAICETCTDYKQDRHKARCWRKLDNLSTAYQTSKGDCLKTLFYWKQKGDMVFRQAPFAWLRLQ